MAKNSSIGECFGFRMNQKFSVRIVQAVFRLKSSDFKPSRASYLRSGRGRGPEFESRYGKDDELS